MRSRYCKKCGGWHDLDEAWPEECSAPAVERSLLPMPNVVGDIEPYRSPLGTGEITSRSHRREDLKRGGCREVDPSEYKHPPVKPRAKWRARQAAKTVH